MKTTFETKLNATFLTYPTGAIITYTADPVADGFRVEVVDTGYECFAEGVLWDKLEKLAKEKAEEHFYENLKIKHGQE